MILLSLSPQWKLYVAIIRYVASVTTLKDIQPLYGRKCMRNPIERNIEIVKAALSGMHYSQIASLYKMTQQRVSQIVGLPQRVARFYSIHGQLPQDDIPNKYAPYPDFILYITGAVGGEIAIVALSHRGREHLSGEIAEAIASTKLPEKLQELAHGKYAVWLLHGDAKDATNNMNTEKDIGDFLTMSPHT